MKKVKLTVTQLAAKRQKEALAKSKAKKQAEKNKTSKKKPTLMERLAALFESFETAQLSDGTEIMYDGDLAEGTVVSIQVEGETLPLPEGTHELGGDLAGTSITVDATGTITGINQMANDNPEAEEIEAMDRTELKKLIKDNDLDITVKKSMTDEDLKSEIFEAFGIEKDDEDEDEDDEEEDEDDEESDDKSSEEMKKVEAIVSKGIAKMNKELASTKKQYQKLESDNKKMADELNKLKGKKKFERNDRSPAKTGANVSKLA